MTVLVLATEAYGGRGGIAAFNRHLLEAMVTWHQGTRVVAVPCRVADPFDHGALTPGIDQYPASGGRLRFPLTVVRALLRAGPFDLVICGHLFLARSARVAALFRPVPVHAVIHGIDAWSPPPRWSIRVSVPSLDGVISVSDFTRQRFRAWSEFPLEKTTVLPNCVDLDHFTPGPENSALRKRYKLGSQRILMTLARLDAKERYKGIDEMLDVLPALLAEAPELVYMIVGDGTDRGRLEAKARGLGLSENVVFTGYIPEPEKVDHYRLADVFVMPGRGEGFGIVYLEAMACGVPVVASTLDASREAVLEGRLGHLADPTDPESIRKAVRAALGQTPGIRPKGIEHFSHEAFVKRVHAFLDRTLPCAE